MQFEDTIRKIIEEKCDDYFLGIADLSLAKNDIIEQGESFFAEYPRAISIGITIPYEITDELLMDKNTAVYKETNCQLKAITAHLSSLLQIEGYKALSVPKTERMNDETFVSLHKLAANLADLGQIEKNGLLVTPEVGSGVNWGTVLTNAPLEAISL
jgi:epoxyqueuosine reductase QueG